MRIAIYFIIITYMGMSEQSWPWNVLNCRLNEFSAFSVVSKIYVYFYSRKILQPQKSDLILQASPLTFDPSIVELFLTLSVGACLLCVPHSVKLDRQTFSEVLCSRNRVTFIQVHNFTTPKTCKTVLWKQ